MRGVPAQERPKNRLNNIPAGDYGRNYVHKNGQVHQPITIEPDGTPVRTIPREEKIARAVQSGDSYVLPGAHGLKPSRQMRETETPASPAQSPDRPTENSTPRPAAKPMQRRSDSGKASPRPSRPETVDVSARADQFSAETTRLDEQRTAPRAMQPRNHGDLPRGGSKE